MPRPPYDWPVVSTSGGGRSGEGDTKRRAFADGARLLGRVPLLEVVEVSEYLAPGEVRGVESGLRGGALGGSVGVGLSAGANVRFGDVPADVPVDVEAGVLRRPVLAKEVESGARPDRGARLAKAGGGEVEAPLLDGCCEREEKAGGGEVEGEEETWWCDGRTTLENEGGGVSPVMPPLCG
jgi:hypothetical protein